MKERRTCGQSCEAPAALHGALREVVEPLARAVVPLVKTLSEADTDAAKKEKKAQESLFQMKLEAR